MLFSPAYFIGYNVYSWLDVFVNGHLLFNFVYHTLFIVFYKKRFFSRNFKKKLYSYINPACIKCVLLFYSNTKILNTNKSDAKQNEHN